MEKQQTLFVQKSTGHYCRLYNKINKLVDDGMDPVLNYNNPLLTNSFAKLCYLLRCDPNLDDVLTLIYSDVGEFNNEDKLKYLWSNSLKNIFSDMSKQLSQELLQHIIYTTNFGEEILVKICYDRDIYTVYFPLGFAELCPEEEYVQYIYKCNNLNQFDHKSPVDSISEDSIDSDIESSEESEFNLETFEYLCTLITNQEKSFFISRKLYDEEQTQNFINESGYDVSFKTHDSNLVAVFKKPPIDISTYDELVAFINARKITGFMSKDMLDNKYARKLLRNSGYLVLTSAIGIHIMRK